MEKGRSRVRTISLHGPESSGKSVLAAQLAAHFRCNLVPEYGRIYCEQHGNDLTMAQLVHIGQAQAMMIDAAMARGGDWLVIDTDAISTAVWAQMMFGHQDKWFASVSFTADLTLLLAPDLPFVQDGVRLFESKLQRRAFWKADAAELQARGARVRHVSGEGAARLACALKGIGEEFDEWA